MEVDTTRSRIGWSVLKMHHSYPCTPNIMDPEVIEGEGCKAMVSLFNGRQTDSLESLRSRFLSKKVCTAKSFVKPERLPPTTFSAKLQSRRTYLQLMQWMCKTNGIQIQLTGVECYKGGNWSPLWWTKMQHQSPWWKRSIAVAPQDAVQRDVAAKRVDLNALQLADIYVKTRMKNLYQTMINLVTKNVVDVIKCKPWYHCHS